MSALNKSHWAEWSSGSMGHINLPDDHEQALPHIYFPRGATIFAAVCAVLFIILGVVGNLITIVALWRSQRLKTHATTWFILSLCVSDLLFCLINLPISASRYIHEAWILGDTLCRLFPFIFYGNVATSLMSLVAITINRYILISHYALYDWTYKRSRVICMIAFVWIFSFSMLIPPMLEVWGQFGLDPPTFSCTILKKDGRSPKKFLFVFGILIPCLVIVFCYTCIFVKVRRSRQNITQHRNVVRSESDGYQTATAQRRDDLRLTKMMLLIFCCFLLCFLPLLVFNVVDDDVEIPTLHVLASVLAWASSVINPFIYAVTNRQYRQAYGELLGCSKRKHGQSQVSRSGSGAKSYITEMIQFNAGLEKAKMNNGLTNGLSNDT